jgi:hypothetical protein
MTCAWIDGGTAITLGIGAIAFLVGLHALFEIIITRKDKM